MNHNRHSSPRKVRPKLYFGVGLGFWCGALAMTSLIAGALYCLLTHRVPL